LDVSQRIARVAVVLTVMVTLGATTPSAKQVKTDPLIIDLAANANDVSGSKGARAFPTAALVIDLAANAKDDSGAKKPINVPAMPLVITL